MLLPHPLYPPLLQGEGKGEVLKGLRPFKLPLTARKQGFSIAEAVDKGNLSLIWGDKFIGEQAI